MIVVFFTYLIIFFLLSFNSRISGVLNKWLTWYDKTNQPAHLHFLKWVQSHWWYKLIPTDYRYESSSFISKWAWFFKGDNQHLNFFLNKLLLQGFLCFICCLSICSKPHTTITSEPLPHAAITKPSGKKETKWTGLEQFTEVNGFSFIGLVQDFMSSCLC